MNNHQPSLFDAQAGLDNRDAAMRRADTHADPAWKAAVADAIDHCARTMAEFSTNDVWDCLQRTGSPTSTHDHRALGPLMRNAATRGLIVKTDRVLNSKLAHQNGRPVAIWRSIVNRKPPE